MQTRQNEGFLAKIFNWKLFAYMFLTAAAGVSLFPFLWMIISSTKSTVDIISGSMWVGDKLIFNLQQLYTMGFYKTLYNSMVITLFGGILSILTTSLAGYGFAKFPSRGKNQLYSAFLFSMMIPFSALMIPLFKLIIKIKLLNSLSAVILLASANVFMLFFFRQNFIGFPKEIIEAARIDGVGEFNIYLKVVVPSMKTTFAAAVIWTAMTQWNSFIWPLIALQSQSKQTITVAISAMGSAYYVEYGPLMCAVVIAVLPLMIVFFSLQKHFVSGIIGASKG